MFSSSRFDYITSLLQHLKKMPVFCFLTITDYPSYMTVHCWWSDLLCCCYPYLEQSAPTCLMSLSHPLFLFSVDASRLSSSGISSYDFLLQLFYIMTVVIFRHLNHAFCSKSIKVQHFWSFVCINMAFLNFIHSQLWLMVWQQHPVCKK